MKKYTAIFKLDEQLHLGNNTVDAATSQRLKKEVLEALKEGSAHFVALDEDQNDNDDFKTLESGTYVFIHLPSHPDNIKGSEGNVKMAAAIILESYNTDLKAIEIQHDTTRVDFAYVGTVHYTIEEKKEPNHYEVYTFVAKGNFGIPTLQKTYKNELVRMCLEALNDADTVLYERSSHTTDYAAVLPEELQVNPFDVLVIQLSIPLGEVEFDKGPAEETVATHFDINVFNAEGIFMPEKIVYDDGDGIRKLIVSLYYESNS